MRKRKIEVYKIISATETTDVYYIFLMPPKRETRGHQNEASKRFNKEKELAFQGMWRRLFNVLPKDIVDAKSFYRCTTGEGKIVQNRFIKVKQELIDHLYFVLRYLLTSDPKYISIKKKYNLIFCGFSIFQRKNMGVVPQHRKIRSFHKI